MIAEVKYLSYEFDLQLKQCGIVSQLTPHGTPQRNGVSEHRNRTLLDMLRSMMYLTDLPLSFWGYALETASFMLKREPSKSVETMISTTQPSSCRRCWASKCRGL